MSVAFQGGDLPFPGSLPEFQELFPTDLPAPATLEAIRWPTSFVCVWCGEPGELYRSGSSARVGLPEVQERQ